MSSLVRKTKYEKEITFELFLVIATLTWHFRNIIHDHDTLSQVLFRNLIVRRSKVARLLVWSSQLRPSAYNPRQNTLDTWSICPASPFTKLKVAQASQIAPFNNTARRWGNWTVHTQKIVSVSFSFFCRDCRITAANLEDLFFIMQIPKDTSTKYQETKSMQLLLALTRYLVIG